MSTVDVERLRGIAETVRQLHNFYHARPIAAQYFKRVCEGAKFVREAETLGAFQGGPIGKKLRHPSCHHENALPMPGGDIPAWKLCVWYAVVDTLAPELIAKRSRSMVIDANGKQSMRFDTSPEEAEIVARAIETGADWLEAPSKGDKGRVETGEDAEGGRAKKTGKKAKGGRKPDPGIARRNRGILGMLKKGKSVNDICERYDVYPPTVYRVKSDAKMRKS